MNNKWILTYANQCIEFDSMAEGFEYTERNKIDNFKLELASKIECNDENFQKLIEQEMVLFNNRKVAN